MKDNLSKNVHIQGSDISSTIIKELHVAVGIIRDANSQCLLHYRPKNLPLGGFWEFPGGIIENEKPIDALKRELFEELNITVTKADPLIDVKFIHDNVLITLHTWIITDYSGEPINVEGQQIKWVEFSKIDQLPMTQPTLKILREFQQTINSSVTSDIAVGIKNSSKLNVETLQWQEVRDKVAAIDSELANIIDKINPDPECKLYKASYRYGDRILAEGLGLNLPLHEGGTVALHNELIVPKSIRDDLSYSQIPITLVLRNSLEVCTKSTKQAIPMRLFSAGEIIGLFETLAKETADKTSNWNLYAGAASMLMSPKIKDRVSHARLQKVYKLNVHCPKGYHDHFDIFQDIANNSNIEDTSWHCEVLFFSRHWLKKLREKPEWLLLNNYLFTKTAHQLQYYHNKLALDRAWHYFSEELTAKHKQYNAYIMDTVKNLISIVINLVPGFRPAQDNSFGPVSHIQRAYMDAYRLPVTPTLMVPSFFNVEENCAPIYYSLCYPSMLTTYPRFKEKDSLITDLIHISSLCSDFYNLALRGRLKVESTILEKAIYKTRFEYFHSKPTEESHYHIRSSQEMPNHDPALIKSLCDKQINKFAGNGRFMRSCIRILRKGEKIN